MYSNVSTRKAYNLNHVRKILLYVFLRGEGDAIV